MAATPTKMEVVADLESGNKTRALVFSANGDCVVSGDEKRVRIWRVSDGKEIKSLSAGLVNCLAVSKDGRWVAAGMLPSDVIVWDVQQGYKKYLTLTGLYAVALDFSPDSRQLLSACFNCTVAIHDMGTRDAVLSLRHDDEIIAAKYSQKGDRFAIATSKLIRVYDRDSVRLFVDIRAEVTPWYNTGLLWSSDQLFIISENKIKQIDMTTRSVASEWPVLDSDASSCIALQQHGEFIAYSTNRTVTIWDTSMEHKLLDSIQHPQIIRSVAISPDNRYLAIGGERGKIIVRRLPRDLVESTPLSRLHPTFQEPDIRIHEAALDAWKQGRLENAEALLTASIPTVPNPNHYALAIRALTRAQLGQWEGALTDVKQSIQVQPSPIGFIAKSIVHVRMGDKQRAYRACDIAFERFHSNHVTFLLLMKAIIVFMAGEHDDAISRIDDLKTTVRFNSICYIVQARMYLLRGNAEFKRNDYERAIHSYEQARGKFRRHVSRQLFVLALISGWNFDDLDITIRQRLCEALYAAGRINEAEECLLGLTNFPDGEARTLSRTVSDWIHEFTQRCLSDPNRNVDIPAINTSNDGRYTPNQLVPTPFVREWVKEQLHSGSWQDALAASASFTVPRFTICRAICEHLEVNDHIPEATDCFHQMASEPTTEADVHDEQVKWTANFKLRCAVKLEHFGDNVMSTQQYDEAISWYSTALSLDLVFPYSLLVKRSKAYVAVGSWEDALKDADQAISLEPSSPWGYESKHAALHQGRDFEAAIATFEKMLSIVALSPDPRIRELQFRYINPADTRTEIYKAIQDAIRDVPRVLINTESGRLDDNKKRAAWFESLPIFKELVSAMTTQIDVARIKQEVEAYYRYATLSHTWEGEEEPLFDQVMPITVYDLKASSTHNKLKTFCEIVRQSGFHWAWSDTCCINKSDNAVLQEALVAMFRWYGGSSLTIVFLCDVHSPSGRGSLTESRWNTRAWTFQEYHASRVVRFYNADWTPYLNLDIPNHKESPEIISEMEQATGVTARSLMTLKPGLNDIREKLCLASQRKTTHVEDAAYSLLGIFSQPLNPMYGEGDMALGRLLSHLLTNSGDTSILAWTGKSNEFNSCLPSKITVFQHFPPPYVPPAIDGSAPEAMTNNMRNAVQFTTQAMKLHDKLKELPVPSFADRRMRLPCLAFRLGSVAPVSSTTPARVFRARADALGVVEITTDEDLSQYNAMTLIHPWIDFLLDRQAIGDIPEIIPDIGRQHRSPSTSTGWSSSATAYAASSTPGRLSTYLGNLIPRRVGGQPSDTLLSSPTPESSTDKRTNALRLVARLKQPFGALLLTPTRQFVSAYRRIASDCEITVRVVEDTPLEMLTESIRILDVL